MVSQRIENRVDENGRLSQIKIFKGSRLDLHLEFEWDSTGYVRATHILKGDLNKYAQLVVWILARFIERIGNIKKVEVMDLLGEITKIVSVEAIKEVHLVPENLIRNGDFETGDLRGWDSDFAAISTTKHSGTYGCHLFGAGTASIYQYVAPRLADLLKFSVWHLSTALDTLRLICYWTDGTSTNFDQVGNAAWQFFSPTLTAGKVLKQIVLVHLVDTEHCYVDDVKLVESVDYRVITSLPAITGTLTQSTKHDAKTYLTIQGGSAADAAQVIANVANKVIKIHRMTIQSSVDGATPIYLYEETSGNQVTGQLSLNAREGVAYPFVSAPACIGQTTTVNKKVLLKNTATKQVYWDITYSVDDAS